MQMVNEPRYEWLIVYRGQILYGADSYEEIYGARAYYGKGTIMSAEEFDRLK